MSAAGSLYAIVQRLSVCRWAHTHQECPPTDHQESPTTDHQESPTTDHQESPTTDKKDYSNDG